MTRQEAIAAIIWAWGQRDSEFCVKTEEREESEKELDEALLALGCTPEEIHGSTTA